MPRVPARYHAAALQAHHQNYASCVGPWGFLRRPTILMSRNWMTSCWSWDHVFNAIACAPGSPDLAWDQLQVHFDLQASDGALPDGVNAEVCGWGYVKPPVHGWALDLLRRHPGVVTPARARAFLPKLEAWTEWWFAHRDSDGDGLPEYHHGNDSGWDNATVFDTGFPVCAPDLQAFLVLQMRALAGLAASVGRRRQAAHWSGRADRHLALLLGRLWDPQRDAFVAFRATDGARPTEGDSLLVHLPIVLGELLPGGIRRALGRHLRPGGRFVREFGPATECPESPLYLKSGYWRGPVWGPVAVLLADGLRRAGLPGHARAVARRFCAASLASGLFPENHDPLTGEPLCDPAYTWGSSAFLILASEFVGGGTAARPDARRPGTAARSRDA